MGGNIVLGICGIVFPSVNGSPGNISPHTVQFDDVLLHVIENINFPFPHKDWDMENQSTVDEYKQKLEEVNIEMALSFGFNIFFNVLMFIPFWWTGKKYLFNF